jgi:polyisoprenoid-binding protein YceI
LGAAPVVYDVSKPPQKSEVVFTSKALTESFDGRAEDLQGSVTLDFSKPDLAMAGKFAVRVDSLRTGISLRDKHLLSRDWFDAERYSLIQFELDPRAALQVEKKGSHQWHFNARGVLTIKGISKNVEIPVILTRDKKDLETITIKAQFPVSLEDHGIRGPAGLRMIGARVSPHVNVRLMLRGKSQPSW